MPIWFLKKIVMSNINTETSNLLLTNFWWSVKILKNTSLLPDIPWGIARKILLWHKFITPVPYSNAMASLAYWRTTEQSVGFLGFRVPIYWPKCTHYSLLINHATGNPNMLFNLPFLPHCLRSILYPKYLLPTSV